MRSRTIAPWWLALLAAASSELGCGSTAREPERSPSPHPPDGGAVAVTPKAEPTNEPAAVEDGGETVTGIPTGSGESSFDVAAWLKAHRIASWRPDPACWRSVEGGAMSNDCLCEGTITVAGQDLLRCQNPHRQPDDAAVPYITHTVLYGADHGKLRLMLDVPTSAAVEGCKADRSDVCWISLQATSEPQVLVLGDGPSGSCDEALQTLDELIRYGEAWRRPWRDIARQICSQRGRYVPSASGLVRKPDDMLGVRRFGVGS